MNVSDIVKIDEHHFMILQDGLLYQVYANENRFVKNLIQEKYYKGKIINDNLKIFEDKKNYLLNLDDGFISLQLKNWFSRIYNRIKVCWRWFNSCFIS